MNIEKRISPNSLAPKDDKRESLVREAMHIIDNLPTNPSFEQGMSFIGALQKRAMLHADGEHISRFIMGVITNRTKASSPQGSGVVDKAAEKFGLSPNTLRLYMNVAHKMHANVIQFDQWLKSGGYLKKQYHVKALVNAEGDPSVLGPEELANQVKRDIERGAERIERISDPQERESLSLLMTDAAEKFRKQGYEKLLNYDGPFMEEPPDEFMDFVRKMACVCCGVVPTDEGQNDPHHFEAGGWAMKGSDWAVIPLCRHCHGKAEDTSPKEFHKKTGVDPFVSLLRVWHLWLSNQDIHLPPYR